MPGRFGNLRFMLSDRQISAGLSQAVRHFWVTRNGQSQKQKDSGRSDQGARSAVTGGKQMDGFVELVKSLVTKSGLPSKCIFTQQKLEIPGYFRPEKKWDLLIVNEGALIAAIEFKSQIGPSFGNNFNNRSEEAIGTAQDLWTAFREGVFLKTSRPWLGYLMMLEDCAGSTTPVSVKEPHFRVFPEFVGASYAQRYQHFLTRLSRERLYDSTCLLMSSSANGEKGKYSSPNMELGFHRFAASLHGHIVGYLNSGP